eukprot:12589916-Alexandrium_andersonii.AAC.1
MRRSTDLVAYQELPGLCAAGPCSRTQASATMGVTGTPQALATLITYLEVPNIVLEEEDAVSYTHLRAHETSAHL